MKQKYLQKYIEFSKHCEKYTDWNTAPDWFHTLLSELTDLWWELTEQEQEQIEQWIVDRCQ